MEFIVNEVKYKVHRHNHSKDGTEKVMGINLLVPDT